MCERYQALVRHRKKTVVVVTAVGRELVGFLWAIAREIEAPGTTAAEASKRKALEALKPGNIPAPPRAKSGRTCLLHRDRKFASSKPRLPQAERKTSQKSLPKETGKKTAAN